MSVDDLSESNEGSPCLILRFKNCTGNIIDLDEDKKELELTKLERVSAQIALSIDSEFKHQRTRRISQAIDMVTR